MTSYAPPRRKITFAAATGRVSFHIGNPPCPNRPLRSATNHPLRLRINTIEPARTRLMKTTRSLRSALFLLLIFLNPPPIHAQLKAQPHLPPLEQPAATSSSPISSAPTKHVIVATLSKPFDVKKLKPGDTFTATASSAASPTYPIVLSGTPIVVRVVEAQPRSAGNDSRLALRFEKAGLRNASQAALQLELEAVASPDFVTWSAPIVIVDRFPCDPNVDRDKCTKTHDDDDSVESQLTSYQRLVCHTKQMNGNARPQNDCVPPSESHGVYGYPDLSLSTAPADGGFAMSSTKKNVKIEKGTLLILSGPDVEELLQQHP